MTPNDAQSRPVAGYKTGNIREWLKKAKSCSAETPETFAVYEPIGKKTMVFPVI